MFNGISLVKVESFTIKIPKDKVLNCDIDEDSLSKGYFIVDKDSAKIKADDETIAFKIAQANM